jgi:hypothetical protein
MHRPPIGSLTPPALHGRCWAAGGAVGDTREAHVRPYLPVGPICGKARPEGESAEAQ